MTGCHFQIEIYAPHGLRGIEPYLLDCLIPLESHESALNGQVILRYIGLDDSDFAMDPSTHDVMHASGALATTWLEASRLVESLSSALYCAQFPHRIGVDDPATDRVIWIEWEWDALLSRSASSRMGER